MKSLLVIIQPLPPSQDSQLHVSNQSTYASLTILEATLPSNFQMPRFKEKLCSSLYLDLTRMQLCILWLPIVSFPSTLIEGVNLGEKPED